jgi:glutamate-1-semialdehyde 2,1-aminomutase
MNDAGASANGAQRQQRLLDDAGRYLAGGGLGLFVLPPELNLVVARGEGARVWDVAGREYLDYHLSSGPALLGHAHPAVREAVRACEKLPCRCVHA